MISIVDYEPSLQLSTIYKNCTLQNAQRKKTNNCENSLHLERIVNAPLKQMVSDIYNCESKYFEVVEKAFEFSGESSEINLKKVLDTTLACAKIEKYADKIADLSNEIDRIKCISKLCGLNAEPDFCPGTDFCTVKQLILNRIEIVVYAFQASQARGELSEFFSEGFRGDPCLNGRLISLTNYHMRKELNFEAQQMKDSFSYDEIAFKCTELMYGLSMDQPPTQSEFISYLKTQEDFKVVYKDWIESKQFPAIYRRAVELFA